MNSVVAAAARQPPLKVASADPPSTWAGLKRELAPRPGRVANTLRLTAIVLIVVVVFETFRIPNISLAAYVAFFLFKSDADATIPQAIIGALAIVSGIMISIVYFAATLAEPALRIPLMAVMSFAAMYLSRTSVLGFAAYGSCLFMVKSLTEGDDLIKGALSPYNDADVERLGLPALAFMPPEEALVHNLLWLALAIAVPAAVVVVVDRLTGPDPERKLRAAMCERLEAMAALCRGEVGAKQSLGSFARQGMTALEAQNAVAGKLKWGSYQPAFGTGLIAATWELMLVLLAFARLPAEMQHSAVLRSAAPALSTAAAAVRNGTATPAEMGAMSGRDDIPPEQDTTARAALERKLLQGLTALRQAIEAPKPDKGAKAVTGFFKPDAFADPGYARFALKVTLAVMGCYLFMNLADWSSVDSCITTCLVVALDSFGQTVRKMVMRVAGALVGAAVGFGYVLFLMPALTDIGQLLAVMAPVVLAGAWIKTGSERVNYFGQQFVFAFILVMLQDYGPTLHFQTGRDRVLGILIGEIAICTVFLHIWPVSVDSIVRKGTAGALDRLAAIVRPGASPNTMANLHAFSEGVTKAKSLLVDDRFEPEHVSAHHAGPVIDADVLSHLQSLAIPVSIIAVDEDAARSDENDAYATYRHDAADWLHSLSRWVGDGNEADILSASVPQPPAAAGDGSISSRAVWCRILDGGLRDLKGLMLSGRRLRSETAP